MVLANQYDLRLQTAGISVGHDKIALRGNPESRSFAVGYFKNGKLIAVDAVKDYVQGRKLIETGALPAPEAFADTANALKSLGEMTK